MSVRRIINGVTIGLIVLLLFFLREELSRAWELLGSVNLYILALLLPLQLINYYANGATLLSFLKKKGSLEKVGHIETGKIALEFNFVNHALPSAGISGVSYMAWRLNKLGVGAGRAALAQVVRVVSIFAGFLLLLPIAVLLITLDGGISRMMILLSASLATAIIFVVGIFLFVLGSPDRLHWFARGVYRSVNYAWINVFRRRQKLLKLETVRNFMEELHDDYKAIGKKPSQMLRPIVWGLLVQVTSVAMFFVVFWSLGQPINPGPILIATGLASISAAIVVTPGGAGLYEALMVAILSAGAGITGGLVLAAVVLTRVILVLFTVGTGYIFYHLALEKYGKPSTQRL